MRDRLGRVAIVAGCVALLLAGACARKDIRKVASEMTGGGDADAGKVSMARRTCNACHKIPGVESSRATGGPTLEHWTQHQLIAKRYPNTPENLIHWIQDPRAMVDTTYMPSMGVSEKEARDIAAYLYTLE